MRRSASLILAICGLCLSFVIPRAGAAAAEIKVLCGGALQDAMTELVSKFEQSSGDKVTIEFVPIGALTNRIQQGEAADVVIVSPAQIATLQQQGKVVPGSSIGLGKVGIGVFIRKGTSNPDISSVDAFKRTQLGAKSLTYPPANGAVAGAYLDGELDRLGIAAALKPKIVSIDQSTDRFQAVAQGNVELGMTQLSEIAAATNVQLVGPLPAEIQNYTSFAAGISANSQQAAAAKMFIVFVSSPGAVALMKTKGIDAF
jgi:molybdate transport system substrate-binding protein